MNALGRKAIDTARSIQALLVLLAVLFPQYASLQKPAETAIASVIALVVLTLEMIKRNSTTPVADPVAADGTKLVKSRARS